MKQREENVLFLFDYKCVIQTKIIMMYNFLWFSLIKIFIMFDYTTVVFVNVFQNIIAKLHIVEKSNGFLLMQYLR